VNARVPELLLEAPGSEEFFVVAEDVPVDVVGVVEDAVGLLEEVLGEGWFDAWTEDPELEDDGLEPDDDGPLDGDVVLVWQFCKGSTYCWSPAEGHEARAAPGATMASVPSTASERTVIRRRRMPSSIASMKMKWRSNRPLQKSQSRARNRPKCATDGGTIRATAKLVTRYPPKVSHEPGASHPSGAS
jgi:hypothetical protein